MQINAKNEDQYLRDTSHLQHCSLWLRNMFTPDALTFMSPQRQEMSSPRCLVKW